MLTFSLISKHNFEDKLKSILDTAKIQNETGITIMTDRHWHMEVFDFMLKHKGIKRIKVAGDTYFIVKEMRVELRAIDYYV